MSYVHTGADEPTFSPRQVRTGSVALFIDRRKAAGKSEAEIRAELTASGPLKKAHPCAGLKSENRCDAQMIDAAFAQAPELAKARAKIDGKLPVKKIAIAALVIGVAYLWWRRRAR